MPYLSRDAGTLFQCAGNTLLPLNVAMAMAYELVLAVVYMHGCGYVHKGTDNLFYYSAYL